MEKKLCGERNMIEIYQIKSSREVRQGTVIHYFVYFFCCMMPSEIAGSKVQNRQRNFLPLSIVKLWQPLPQSAAGTKTLPRFKKQPDKFTEENFTSS